MNIKNGVVREDRNSTYIDRSESGSDEPTYDLATRVPEENTSPSLYAGYG